ncbi:ribonuclease H-like domain-containing protein, partial [Tanacetum coccineum]
MIAIRMKNFYKKTRRRARIDGNKPVGFDKKKLECFKCHNTGHFARECPSKGTNDGKKRDSFYQDQGAGKKEQNQNCLLTMDDGVVNWGEHTVEEEETNHALMAISSNTECRTMTVTHSGMTPEAIEELINRRMEEALAAYEEARAANALEAENQSQNSSDGDNGNGGNGNDGNGNGGNGNGGNRNGGNGNGGNGNPNENGRGDRLIA